MTPVRPWRACGVFLAALLACSACNTGASDTDILTSGSGSAAPPDNQDAASDPVVRDGGTDLSAFRARVRAALAQGLPEEVSEFTVNQDGMSRPFLVYTPAGFQRGNSAVLLLHGGGGSMRTNFIYPATARWRELADEHGFLLLSPNGVNARSGDPTGDRQTWNGLRPGLDGRRSQADDVSYLEDVVHWAVTQREVDRTRIYTVGASNGGEMVHRLLIERPGMFAAGVSHISNLPANAVPNADPPTPIMILNGTEDPLMPYEGGAVRNVAEPVRSVEETLSYWIAMHGLDEQQAMTTRLPDSDPNDGCRITQVVYPAQPDTPAPLVFYRVEGGGHSVPLPSEAERPEAMRRLLGNACRDADGAALAWEFMQQHGRDSTARRPRTHRPER